MSSIQQTRKSMFFVLSENNGKLQIKLDGNGHLDVIGPNFSIWFLF